MLRVGGVVLCGGQSSRMGRPKAWLPVGGETMLGRVVRLIGEAVPTVVVVAAPGQDVPPLPPGVTVVRDAESGRGPLQGLAAGLAALRGQVDVAYASSCDVPLLKPAFVARMISLLGGHDVCVPDVGGYRHPLAAVYRVGVAGVAARLLAEGRNRPAFLFEQVPTRFVGQEAFADVDAEADSLRNVNTPGEYAAALADLNLS